MLLHRAVTLCMRFIKVRTKAFVCTSLFVLVLLALLSQTFVTFSRSAGNKEHHNEIVQHSPSSQVYLAVEEFLKKNPRKQRLLILGYMRSGSTLCGDILQTHPRVFYVYEPTLYLWDHYIPGRKPHENIMKKRAKTEFQRFMNVIPTPEEFLHSMFECNTTIYNLRLLTNIPHSRDFRGEECKMDRQRFYGVHEDHLPMCAATLNQHCNKADVIVQKTVRINMKEAESLLEKDTNIKIIHLIRDPRGSLLSRMYFSNKTTGEMHKNISNICKRLSEDVAVSQSLASRFWGRILTVRYEDLAQNPMKIAAMMYRFSGLEFLPSVKAYLEIITHSEVLASGGKPQKKSTSRKDPLKTAYQWREELSFTKIHRIDQKCAEMFKTMGYIAFTTEQQARNLSFPAKRDKFGSQLMTVY